MFLPSSLLVSKSIDILILILILICSAISHWLGTFQWNDCLFVSNRFLIPMHDSIIFKISVLPAWLCYFYLPFLQWWWIRIDVSINQPFISKITMLIFTNDPTIILNIHKWWWLQSTNHNQIMVWIGLFNNDSKQVASNNQEDWVW